MQLIVSIRAQQMFNEEAVLSVHLDTVIIPKLKELRTSPILMNGAVSQGTVNHATCVCYLSVSMLKYLLTFHDTKQIIIRSNSSKTVYNTNNCRCCHPNLLLLYSVDKQVWCHAEISVTTEPIFVFAVYSKTTQSLGIIILFILRLIKRQKHIPWNSNNPGDDCTFDRYVLTIWDTNNNIAILLIPDVIMC